MPQSPRQLVRPIAVLAGTLLLDACEQASPGAAMGTGQAAAPPLTHTKRTTGTAADSLNGIQGHTFGEPLRNFPGLILLEKHDEEGVRWYRMPAGREHGWVCRVPDYLLSISRRPVFHV